MGVGAVEGRTIAHDLAMVLVRIEWHREAGSMGCVPNIAAARERGELYLIAHKPGQRTQFPPEQADRALHDRIEHGLDVRLGLADDAQNVAGRRLLIERRGQITVARLKLLEQTHILDRNNRLVGERLEEVDLAFGEATRFAASHPYSPDGPVVTEHRHDHPASKATDGSVASFAVSQPSIRVRISDIERCTVTNGPRVHPHGLERFREGRPYGGITCGVGAREHGELDLLVLDQGQGTRVPSQQPYRAPDDR